MMKRSTQLAAAVGFFVLNAALQAQQIAGQWQGTVDLPEKYRIVLKMEETSAGLKATIYSIDQSPSPLAADQVSFSEGKLKLNVPAVHGSYEGTLGADGRTIAGTFTQGKPATLNFERVTSETGWKIDPSPHTVKMVPVEKDVTLEVLDWGGSGRPLVLLTGLGNDAHVYDKFAPKLTDKYHVYGITRRGFGESSKPTPNDKNYTAGRLGEDVVAVIDALHIYKPVIAGHSLGGEELSYIATKHPDKTAGLIYLDAGYPYALYDEVNGSVFFDSMELVQQLQLLQQPGKAPTDQQKYLSELQSSLTRMQSWVTEQQENFKALPPPPPGPGPRPDPPPMMVAIMSGQQKFTTFNVPALLIFASPHDRGQKMYKDNPTARAAADAMDKRGVERQATAFERQVPSARVVRIANANHYVFQSNEADVLREMNAFIAALPSAN